jgi:hypothetical protein
MPRYSYEIKKDQINCDLMSTKGLLNAIAVIARVRVWDQVFSVEKHWMQISSHCGSDFDAKPQGRWHLALRSRLLQLGVDQQVVKRQVGGITIGKQIP